MTKDEKITPIIPPPFSGYYAPRRWQQMCAYFTAGQRDKAHDIYRLAVAEAGWNACELFMDDIKDELDALYLQTRDEYRHKLGYRPGGDDE